jgi:hypothetical protein
LKTIWSLFQFSLVLDSTAKKMVCKSMGLSCLRLG